MSLSTAILVTNQKLHLHLLFSIQKQEVCLGSSQGQLQNQLLQQQNCPVQDVFP